MAKSPEAKTDTATPLLEFEKRVALLLKHDWERVKLEAKPGGF